MKSLNGRELVDFIKERQAHQVRHIFAVSRRAPKLVIFYDNDSPVIAKYMELKKRYGEDIRVEVEIQKINSVNAEMELRKASESEKVDGIIVQLPLEAVDDSIIDLIPFEKDVDGLRGKSDTATAMAIHWLLNGYNIELKAKKIAIVGRGKLVGAPLEKMWRESGLDVTVFELGANGEKPNLGALIDYDIIVSATGAPGLIKSEMLRSGAVAVDAGTASEGGVIRGDLDEKARERNDLILTPKVGGVGPLTVAMLFENLIQAVLKTLN